MVCFHSTACYLTRRIPEVQCDVDKDEDRVDDIKYDYPVERVEYFVNYSADVTCGNYAHE